MYKLHWSACSGAFAPHAALAETGARHELVEVDLDAGEHHAPRFLALNPRAQVPVLTLPDGTAMTESAAIMIHLADCHPQARLLPAVGTSERARAYRWLVFGALNLYETGCRIADTHHYSANETDFDGIRAKARGDLDRYWDMVGEALGDGPFLLGRDFSACDIYLLMLSQWHPDKERLVSRLPPLAALCERVRSRPAIDAIWERNFPS